MDATQFKSLRFGNMIQRIDGRKFMVTMTTRAENGDCLAAAITPAIQEAEAEVFSVIANDYNRTVLHGETVRGK